VRQKEETLDALNDYIITSHQSREFAMRKSDESLKELWVFLGLTLGLTTLIFWGPLAVLGIPGASLSGASGPPWAIALYVIGGFMPSPVTIFLNWQGKTLRAMWKRLAPRTVSSKWHLAILGVVVLGTVGQLIIIRLLAYAFDSSLFLSRLMMLLPLLILGPLSEEFGWRGYALDRLQTRWNALTSSLILGVIWSLWHLPLFYIVGTSQYLYDISFLGFMLGTTTTSVLYTWAYNNTGSSIWSAVFFHWVYTYALDTLGVGMTPPPVDYQLLQYAPYILIAIAVVVIWGPKTLTRQRGNGVRPGSGGHDG
jgi:membrane protease YdiL (CAAX protease family)